MSTSILQRREVAADACAAAKRAHLCFVALHAWPVISGDARIAEVGGAEVQQVTLARLFAAHGYRVSMVCLDYGQQDRAVIDGITVHKAFRLRSGLPVLRFVHPRLTRIWRALSAADADVYYCRAAGMMVGVVAQFCRRHGRRSVYAGASNMDFVPGEGGQIRYARDRWLYRRGLAAVDRIVAQNEPQRESCRKYHGRDAVVIPSCYVRRSSNPRALPQTVLWVGTIRPGKRPEMFVELARRLPHRQFVMVGGPGDAALFKRIAQAAESVPNLELTGFLPLDQTELRFDAARVLVNTSEFEGMPNTFLQAWARGVPTLATVDAGTPVHRGFGSLEEAAQGIEALFADAERWRSASRACREHFERTHSGEVTLERYGRLFDELTA